MEWVEVITEPGWYWRRDKHPLVDDDQIVEVRLYGGKLCILNWEIPTENVLWAGPILHPDQASRAPKGE